MGTTRKIIKKLIGDEVVRIKDALEEERNDVFRTGIKSLDDLMDGGVRQGDLIVISGRSGEGKTTFGLNIIKNFADVGIMPVLFSYEVRINPVYQTLRDMGMEEDPNVFTPKKNVTGKVDWIEEKIKEATEKFMTNVVIIDHLDFITSDHDSDEGRRNEINNIMLHLKDLAVREDLIIFLQVHVVKNTQGRNLSNEDLADSREIANLADYVIFVNRKKDTEGLVEGNEGRLVITKNRYNGKQGIVNFWMDNNVIRTYAE